jgi:transcription elongation factor GreA
LDVEGGDPFVEEVTLTAEGLEKLRDEVDRLSTIGRKEIAERLEEAREFGDLVENSEYQEARKEQELLERRIAVLEERLRSARVVTAEGTPPEVVGLGTEVRLRDLETRETIDCRIVGSAEADPIENDFSSVSPVGRAIVGRKKGDSVEVEAPTGPRRYKIVDVKAA